MIQARELDLSLWIWRFYFQLGDALAAMIFFFFLWRGISLNPNWSSKMKSITPVNKILSPIIGLTSPLLHVNKKFNLEYPLVLLGSLYCDDALFESQKTPGEDHIGLNKAKTEADETQAQKETKEERSSNCLQCCNGILVSYLCQSFLLKFWKLLFRPAKSAPAM